MRADAREFLAAPRPERPLRAQIFSFPIAFGCNECTTRICGQTESIPFLLIFGILGRLRYCTACCRGRCPHRPCKYWAPPANTQMACHFHGSVFCHLPAWKLLSMGALSPRRRRCSSALQRVYRVLAAAFFEGVLLRLAVQSDPLPAPLFAHFFWQDRKSGSAKRRLRCHRERGSPVKTDKRTARGPAANSRRQFSITCPPVTGIA